MTPGDDHHGSASGTPVPAIARLVAADEDAVREVIHRFNEIGPAAPDPRWAGGCPRRISTEDEEFILATAATCPRKLGRPSTWWSLRRLAGYLARNLDRIVRIGRERLRQILRGHGISFQRRRTARGDGPCGAHRPAAGPAPDLSGPS